jgi:hypothetical protein
MTRWNRRTLSSDKVAVNETGTSWDGEDLTSIVEYC